MPNKRSRSNSPDQNVAKPPSEIPTIYNRTTSIANVVVEGFAWGTGTSIARKIFTTEEPKNESKNNEKINNIDDLWKQYKECIEKSKNENEINKCSDILFK
jgi:hypothetical protein